MFDRWMGVSTAVVLCVGLVACGSGSDPVTGPSGTTPSGSTGVAATGGATVRGVVETDTGAATDDPAAPTGDTQ